MLGLKKLEAQKSAKGLGARGAGFSDSRRTFGKENAQSHSQTIFVENKLGNNIK